MGFHTVCALPTCKVNLRKVDHCTFLENLAKVPIHTELIPSDPLLYK